jgi:hypothetical protein
MSHGMKHSDVVVDDNMNPIFSGAPEQTLEWLESRPSLEGEVRVYIGDTLRFVTVAEYLQQFG